MLSRRAFLASPTALLVPAAAAAPLVFNAGRPIIYDERSLVIPSGRYAGEPVVESSEITWAKGDDEHYAYLPASSLSGRRDITLGAPSKPVEFVIESHHPRLTVNGVPTPLGGTATWNGSGWSVIDRREGETDAAFAARVAASLA